MAALVNIMSAYANLASPGAGDIALATAVWGGIFGLVCALNRHRPTGEASALQWSNQWQSMAHCLVALVSTLHK